nr:TetR family transcriptional regulator [uncultured bacterium]
MPKQERAERTRTAILDAAAKVFDDHGFFGATLSDILQHADVTKGALYFHFQSKEQIAHALIDEQFDVWQALRDEPDVGLQTVIDLTHAMARRLQEDVRVRASIRLVIEQGTFTNPAPDAYQQWIDVVESCLAQAKAKGDLHPELNTNDVATYITGSFTGVQVSSEVLTHRTDITKRVTTMWHIILPGLVPPRRRAKFSPEGSA